MRVRPFAVPSPRAIATWARRRPFEGDVRALLHHDRDDVALPLAAFESARRAVLAFRVYPETLLRARVGTADGNVAPGATIVQRVRIGPASLEAGCRVLDVWDRPDAAGFRYVTLRGHPECGIATFAVERSDRAARFVIASDSQPERWLKLIGRAAQARRLQRRAVAGALARMRDEATR